MSGTSHPEHRQWAKARYERLGPETVIDVGAGSGTYARAFRAPGDASHWTAVEVHQAYIDRYRLADVYDAVVCADARTYLAGHEADLVILGDVVEHVTMDEGRQMLRDAMRSSAVLLSIPLGRYDQGPLDGNQHEAHLATWEHDDVFDVLGPCDHVVGAVVGTYLWVQP